jgi:hypothetical protein
MARCAVEHHGDTRPAFWLLAPHRFSGHVLILPGPARGSHLHRHPANPPPHVFAAETASRSARTTHSVHTETRSGWLPETSSIGGRSSPERGVAVDELVGGQPRSAPLQGAGAGKIARANVELRYSVIP